MLKLLFICDAGLRRSPTAADVFADRAETRFRGVRAELIALLNFAPPELQEQAKKIQLTVEDFAWADRIFYMDKRNEVTMMTQFGWQFLDDYWPKMTGLWIPDRFDRGDPRLIAGLESLADYIVGVKDPRDMPRAF